MYIFQSMNHITAFTIITIIVLLFLALKANPINVVVSFVKSIFTSKKNFFHLIALIGILLINTLELMIEKKMNYHVDFTPLFQHVEGNFVAKFQTLFANHYVTLIATYFYIIILPSIMFASIGIYTYQKNYTLFYALCYGLLINYVIAIPFYLFFPVNEVWSYSPHVRFMMLDVFPAFEKIYRPLSGLNNCFPSLHTSLSMTLALIAFQSGNVFWRRFTMFSAWAIIFSIFYLGIHWLTDMVGGLILAVVASSIALRMANSQVLFKPFAYSQQVQKEQKLRG